MKKTLYFFLLLLFLISVSSCNHKPWTEKTTILSAKVVDYEEGEVCDVAIGVATGNMGIGYAVAKQPVLYLKITGQKDTISLKISHCIIGDLKKQKTKMIKVKKTVWFDGNTEKETNYEFVSIE